MANMDPIIEKLAEHSWNRILPALAALDPDLYAVAVWLHVAGEVDLDDGQIREWLAALVRANAI